MDLKLELLPVPVTDVDRAKACYGDKLGFVVDIDDQPMESVRVVQLTPSRFGLLDHGGHRDHQVRTRLAPRAPARR